jgi:hypothetical protein
MYYNLICIFICTPICTKSYSCKKWVLHIGVRAVPRGRGQEGLRDFDGGEELRHRDDISRCQAG